MTFSGKARWITMTTLLEMLAGFLQTLTLEMTRAMFRLMGIED